MSNPKPLSNHETLVRLREGLRMVCMSLPHLSELAGMVRLQVEPRTPTAGIFQSGRLVFNPTFAASLTLSELTFVLAHELLHLALKTHQRGITSDPLIVNYAHDYIINDILVHALGQAVPAGGLHREGTRFQSLEKLVAELERQRDQLPPASWQPPEGGTNPPGGSGLRGLMQGVLSMFPGSADSSEPPPPGDVLPADLERAWYPDAKGPEQQVQAGQINDAAARAANLQALVGAMAAVDEKRPGSQAGRNEISIAALKLTSQPLWQQALQRWWESTAPRTRSYARPSRRGGQRRDVVLPGRIREGWTLHIVLDCSGSMFNDLPLALGAISAFTESVGVEQVHLLQCDVELTREEWVSPAELANYAITGLGGTDLTPALLKLADDPEVEVVMVLTDEDVLWAPHLPTPPAFDLLWVLMRPIPDFRPPYGQVIHLPVHAATV